MQDQGIVAAWEGAWNSRDVESVIDLYSGDVYFRDPTTVNGIQGLDTLRSYLKRLFVLYPATRITVIRSKSIKGEAQQFLVWWHAQVPDQVDGTSITEIDGVTRLVVEKDRITREETFYDRLPIALDLVYLLRQRHLSREVF